MEITATIVKELRDKTGLGMMICKQSLVEANGDMELAIENLRKTGQATAAKRAGKTAKEGKITIAASPECTVVFEVNSETDFVARNEDFIAFVDLLGSVLLEKQPADINAAREIVAPEFGGISIANRVTELIGKIGENISFRRYNKMTANVSKERMFTYLHGNGKIGVVVKLSSDNAAAFDSAEIAMLGKDIAMQIAASNPVAANKVDISDNIIAKEKNIYCEQAKTSGKPEKIWDKIVDGKLEKFFQEVVLIEQAYIKNPEVSLRERISEAEKATGSKIGIIEFLRLELGAEE